MTRDEIISMAREAGLLRTYRDADISTVFLGSELLDGIERFATLVAAHERDEAWAEVEGLRSALLTLANAADDVGVQFFDMEDPPISVAQMQSATLAARAAAEIGRQMEEAK